MKTIMEGITTRRSIRRYLPDTVSQSVLADILEAVRWSPSWANNQCWEIVVINEQTIKEKLQSILSEKNPATNAMINAPLVLAVCGRKVSSGFYKGEAVTKFGDWMLYDLGIATQSILLAAKAHGLGTVVVGAFDHAAAGKILNLPENVDLVTLIPLGYPDHEPGPPTRKPQSDFVHHNQYRR